MSGCGRRGIRRRRVDGRVAMKPCTALYQAEMFAIRSGADSHRMRRDDAPKSNCRVQAKPKRYAGPNKSHRHARAPAKIGALILLDLRESGKPGRLRCAARSLSMWQRNMTRAH